VLAVDVGTGLFERSAVAIVVEGGQVERKPESVDWSARYSRPRRRVRLHGGRLRWVDDRHVRVQLGASLLGPGLFTRIRVARRAYIYTLT
jgi:hypothetical protein